MQPFFQEPRPPYFEFDTRAEERRNPAPPAGDGVVFYESVDYIIITPAGSKDRYEQVVGPYFENLKKLVKDQMFPPKWLEVYQKAYEDWKRDNAFELSGTSVKNWPVLAPGEVKALLSANIRTVEDLADANEGALARIGIGGRAMKQKAQDWLTAKTGTAPLLQQLDAMRRALEASNATLEAQNKRMLQLEHLATTRAAPPPVDIPAGFLTASKPAGPTAQQLDDQLIDAAL